MELKDLPLPCIDYFCEAASLTVRGGTAMYLFSFQSLSFESQPDPDPKHEEDSTYFSEDLPPSTKAC